MARSTALVVGLALSFVLTVALPPPLLCGGYEEEVLKDSPVAYWRLGERDLLDPIQDSSGNGTDGVYDSLGNTGLEPGHAGAIVGDPDTAVRFQTIPGFRCGDCGQGQMPVGGLLDLGFEGDAAITLEAWFQLLPSADAVLPASAFPRILHYNFDGGRYAFGVVGDDTAGYPDSRTVWAAVGARDTQRSVIKAAPCGSIWPADEPDWYHLVATIRADEEWTEIRLFLNGKELTDLEDSDPIYWAAPQATIGGRRESPGMGVQGFPGLLDELAIYGAILPEERIRAHFTAGRPPPEARVSAPTTTGVVPLTVELDGSASTPPAGGAIEGYHWHFGDGETADAARVTHVYKTPGEYVANLRVASSLGTTDHAGALVRADIANADVSPWASADIGVPRVPGGAGRAGDCLDAFAGGGDLGGTADACRFLYLEKSGDFALTAKAEAPFWQPGERAAVMLRSSLDSNAPMAAMTFYMERTVLSPSCVVRAGPEDSGENLETPIPFDPPFVAPRLYLRLARRGDWIIGSLSHDGESFAEVRRHRFTGLPDTLLAGLAVSGRDVYCTGRVAAVTFCDIAFGPAPPPLPAFHRGDADGNGQLEITDAVRILDYLFLGNAALACLEAADADDSGALQLTDAILILGHLFLGFPAPPHPGPPPDLPAPTRGCGIDSGWVHLGCEEFLGC